MAGQNQERTSAALSITKRLLSGEPVSADESNTDLIPYVANMLANSGNDSAFQRNYSNIESFFSRFAFKSAIPNLLTALRASSPRFFGLVSPPLVKFLVQRDNLGKVTYSRTEDRGNWKVQDDYLVTYKADKVKNIYRNLSPIGEGAKKALETLTTMTDQNLPEILKAIRRYEDSRAREIIEIAEENEREISAEPLGRGDGR